MIDSGGGQWVIASGGYKKKRSNVKKVIKYNALHGFQTLVTHVENNKLTNSSMIYLHILDFIWDLSDVN